MDMRKVVGLNVLRLRRERGISQEELSFRSGFGRAYLSGLETGKRNPTVVSLSPALSARRQSICYASRFRRTGPHPTHPCRSGAA